MKVFIYDKKTNNLKRVITDVVEVHDQTGKIIYIRDTGEEFHVPKRLFKSTAYQN